MASEQVEVKVEPSAIQIVEQEVNLAKDIKYDATEGSQVHIDIWQSYMASEQVVKVEPCENVEQEVNLADDVVKRDMLLDYEYKESMDQTVVITSRDPEFICIKPEPVDNLEVNFEGEAVENDIEGLENDNNSEADDNDNHYEAGGISNQDSDSQLLKEVKTEHTDSDNDDIADSDVDSNGSDTELPKFDESSFKRSSTGQYQCPTCLKWLCKKGNLQRHLFLVHDKEKMTCKYCGKVLPSISKLKKHIFAEHQKSYECEECHKLFRTSSNLGQHMRSHIKPYQCELCDKSFGTMGNLLKHRGKSRCKKPSTQPLHCEICDKTFRKPYLYKSHQVMHTTERPFSCDICRMTFKQNSALVRHKQLHFNDKPFSCDICGKKFTSKGLLKPHLRTHTGEKPYTCPVCQKGFTHKHNMQTHSLLHNKVKHLICAVCHKEFPRESRLKYHMRKHMPDNRPFKCEHCPKSYSCKQNIIRHYKKKHPNQTYSAEETDASIATIMWETVIKKKLDLRMQTDYILPEEDVPEEAIAVPVICEYSGK